MFSVRGRSRLGLTVLACAAALIFSGCGGAEKNGGTAKSSDKGPWSASAGLPAVSGAFGTVPKIEAGQGKAPKSLAKRVLVKGTGAEIKGDDILAVNYQGQLWDGKVFDSSFKRGAAAVFSLNQVVKGWKQGLTGMHVGDRVELTIPPSLGYGNQAAGSIPANSTLVFVIDILGQVDPKDLSAVEDSTPVKGLKLPTNLQITGKPGEKPEIKADGFKAGKQPQHFVLLEGKGRPIEGNDVLVVHSTGLSLGKGKEESTYDRGMAQAFSQPVSANPKLLEAFTGVRVGSRVVYIMPAAESNAQPGAGNQGLVIVVDVVGALKTK